MLIPDFLVVKLPLGRRGQESFDLRGGNGMARNTAGFPVDLDLVRSRVVLDGLDGLGVDGVEVHISTRVSRRIRVWFRIGSRTFMSRASGIGPNLPTSNMPSIDRGVGNRRNLGRLNCCNASLSIRSASALIAGCK